MEEVVKSIGASDEFDGMGASEEEESLLLGWEENCRLTEAQR